MITQFADYLINRSQRTPYHDIGDYMGRSWLVPHNADESNWAARVHNVKRSDHDRALHDHPWFNISWLLKGGYWEIKPGRFQQAVEARFIDAADEFLSAHNFIHLHAGGTATRAQLRAYRSMGIYWRGPGALVFRKPTTLHRLVLPEGKDAWSLFIMGPKKRDWGFQTPEGWVHADVYRAALGRAV